MPGGSPDTDAHEAVATSAAPESPAPAVTTPESAPAEHEDAPASSREDQTEA